MKDNTTKAPRASSYYYGYTIGDTYGELIRKFTKSPDFYFIEKETTRCDNISASQFDFSTIMGKTRLLKRRHTTKQNPVVEDGDIILEELYNTPERANYQLYEEQEIRAETGEEQHKDPKKHYYDFISDDNQEQIDPDYPHQSPLTWQIRVNGFKGPNPLKRSNTDPRDTEPVKKHLRAHSDSFIHRRKLYDPDGQQKN